MKTAEIKSMKAFAPKSSDSKSIFNSLVSFLHLIYLIYLFLHSFCINKNWSRCEQLGHILVDGNMCVCTDIYRDDERDGDVGGWAFLLLNIYYFFLFFFFVLFCFSNVLCFWCYTRWEWTSTTTGGRGRGRHQRRRRRRRLVPKHGIMWNCKTTAV